MPFTTKIYNFTNYYPFGMQQTGTAGSYDLSSDYRYGYNGKEKDDELKGEANSLDYGARIYDPRVGKFLSVDPLTSNFAAWTPYAFSMNRPIDGIDLDGLEYLRADEAKIEVYEGKVLIKLENCSNVLKSLWRELPNSHNSIGHDLTYGSVDFNKTISDPDPGNPTDGYYANKTTFGNLPVTKKGAYDKRYNIIKRHPDGMIVTGVIANTTKFGKTMIALDVLSLGLTTSQTIMVNNDFNQMDEQMVNELELATADVEYAVSQGIIPQNFMNQSDLSNIINYVFQGTMKSDNRELWDVGKKVISEVTNLRNSIHVGGASKEQGRDNTSVPRTYDALENTQKK